MLNRKKLFKVIQSTFRRTVHLPKVAIKQINSLLRTLLVVNRGKRHGFAGFVLPTVTMVILVVVLLTTAILIRSFDRTKNASNYRIDQVVLNAASPALDRAKAKIEALFSDPRLPRGTPADSALAGAFSSTKYNFGDETRLKLIKDVDGNSTIDASTETLDTAWKFPVDTDNDGFFDSFTLYGIYFKNPPRAANKTKFSRSRSTLEARAFPMSQGEISGCDAGSEILSDSDWVQTSGQFKKAFFIYTATVPITDVTGLDNTKYKKFVGNKGFSAIEAQQDRARIPLNNNAVWFEDDIEINNPDATFTINGRVHTNSNLLVAGADTGSSAKVRFYQVSSRNSCFYLPENGKIEVGGNVGNGSVGKTADVFNATFDLYKKATTPITVEPSASANISKTTTALGGATVGYNTKAYGDRIGRLVDGGLNLWTSTPGRIPADLVTNANERIVAGDSVADARRKELEIYFRQRVRRVPYAEIPYGGNALFKNNTAAPEWSDTVGSGDFILGASGFQIPPNWMSIAPANTGLTLNFVAGDKLRPYATDPDLVNKDPNKQEKYIGDRLLVGNNRPQYWLKPDNTFSTVNEPENLTPVKWNGLNAGTSNPDDSVTTNFRTRTPQVSTLDDLGDFGRNGYWEKASAKALKNDTTGALLTGEENPGGLRIITGAGIYVDGVATASGGTGRRVANGGTESFLPTPELTTGVTTPANFTFQSTSYTPLVVWPDSLPMSDPNPAVTGKGDLQMRASAVYHHVTSADTAQIPRACVSSYYDPSTSATARNEYVAGSTRLPDVSGLIDTNNDGTLDSLADGSAPSPVLGSNAGRSNNGVVYAFNAYTDASGRISAATGTYKDKLARQASMVFPNGRFVNEPLRKALQQINTDSSKLTLADNAAIDTAICALKILEAPASFAASPTIPHGAVREVAFLDGREIKSIRRKGTDKNQISEIHADLTDDVYTLPLEQRQPLEIRVTEINLQALKNYSVAANSDTSGEAINNNEEYLLPNSGVIYASRDDALLDLSADDDNLNTATTQQQIQSSRTDFKLDPSRRPNGIRLVNGSDLARQNTYRLPEKGLILVTNDPLYLLGDFNRHRKPGTSTDRAEFTDTASAFYDRATKDYNFACRKNQTGCGSGGDTEGDQWRAAALISDSITLLSGNFRDGFRNQGDYDLRNNIGNAIGSSVDVSGTRLKRGFWYNNFVTSRAYWNTTANVGPANTELNSYFANGVTPIQRRLNTHEYVMEVCRKVLISQCGKDDWYIGYDANEDGDLDDAGDNANENSYNFLKRPLNDRKIERLGAGTTARLAVAADRRYPRRVAFTRNQFQSLKFTQIGSNAAAIPLGINSSGRVEEFPYSTSTNPTLPRKVDNALWYRTTTSTTGDPGAAASISYANDKSLYYLPPELDGETLIAPKTQCFNFNTSTLAVGSVVTCPTTYQTGVINLNLPDNADRLSAYTVCANSSSANGGGSKNYAVGQNDLKKYNSSASLCPAEPSDISSKVYGGSSSTTGLSDLAANIPATALTTTSGGVNGGTLNAVGRINVYDFPASKFNPGQTLTLSANGQSKPIFVLKLPANFTFGSSTCTSSCGVKIAMNDVDPNDVFWIADSISFEGGTTTDAHTVIGNYIGKNAAPALGNNVDIQGGRFLGYTSVPQFSSGFTVTAVTSNAQPLLTPMLQIHTPTGTPSTSSTVAFSGFHNNDWMQRNTSQTHFNAVFVTGDTPSRPARSTYAYESSGGLNNFPRFLEVWEATGEGAKTKATISGSFIEAQKSAFATAPFQVVDSTVNTSIFYTSGNDYADSSGGFVYRGGAAGRRAPFYRAPERDWGYDVGLLSQSPDLFSRRFTSPQAAAPNEFYREVGREDAWIKTLLCAAQANTAPGNFGNAPSSYGSNQRYALPETERGSCPG